MNSFLCEFCQNFRSLLTACLLDTLNFQLSTWCIDPYSPNWEYGRTWHLPNHSTCYSPLTLCTNQHEIVVPLPLKIRSYFPLTVSGSKSLQFINTYPSCFLVKIGTNHYFWESQVLSNDLFLVMLGLRSWENFISLHVLLQSEKTVSMEIFQNKNNLLMTI